MEKQNNLTLKTDVNLSDYDIGVIIMRAQVHKLHGAHEELIDIVCENHKQVIIFLGVPVIENTKSNPLDYATRRIMIQEMYPNVVILPIKDNRSDEIWSENLDSLIKIPFGEKSALLYGSRGSFIEYYKGRYKTIELISNSTHSGTEMRKEVSKEILASEDFRAGVIHATYAKRPVTYPTVDIVAYNDKGEILLAKKPNEALYRFIGGFVDRTDISLEQAAKREFREETGGCEIDTLKYVGSTKVDDWRYRNTESGIMTTLFIGKFIYGRINPSDDISILEWVNPFDINIEKDIMPEHQGLFGELLGYIEKNKLK